MFESASSTGWLRIESSHTLAIDPFAPRAFVDRCETALIEMLQAKQAGRVIEAPKPEIDRPSEERRASTFG